MFFSVKCFTAAAFICMLCACNNRGSTATQKSGQFALTVNLPFESANYYYDDKSDPNFILKDSMGRLCTAITDTVTKGGGTVMYSNLPAGIYTYSIRTLFDETVTRSFKLAGDTSMALYPVDIYGAADAITLEELLAADAVKIILNDTLTSHTISLQRENNKYRIGITASGSGKHTTSVLKDSATTIQALIDLQVTLLGLNAMEVYEAPDMPPYDPVTGFYMKTGKAFVSCTDIPQRYFYAAHKKFITAITQQP